MGAGNDAKRAGTADVPVCVKAVNDPVLMNEGFQPIVICLPGFDYRAKGSIKARNGRHPIACRVFEKPLNSVVIPADAGIQPFTIHYSPLTSFPRHSRGCGNPAPIFSLFSLLFSLRKADAPSPS
jgi:hypothetical protein